MPQIEPEFEIMHDAEQMIVKICDLYPDKFGHIDPNVIGVAAITNKNRPDSQAFDSSMVGIKPPITLYTQKRYIIYFFKNIWDGYTPAQKGFMLIAKLSRIDEELTGKVLPEDLKDVKCLVKAFGVDYLNNPHLPDPLDMKQIF